ncbi:MAG: MmcQ/YjbR family DNA-binding protein [Acidobacteriota bacterium]|nr:MmcQ/YjbR family DNA-binding protein [Acidobacteriota bacterium]
MGRKYERIVKFKPQGGQLLESVTRQLVSKGFKVNIDEVRILVMSLPEVIEEPHHKMISFRVRGKIFATVPPGGEHLHIFVGEEDRERIITIDPAFEKLWWGSKVAGVRVDLARGRSASITEMLHLAWCRKAPKRLVTTLGSAWNKKPER